MKLKGFVGPTYHLDAVSFDCQRLVNMYPMVSELSRATIATQESTSKAVTALRSCPGYELAYTAGGGPIRGEIVTGQDRAFVVSGNELYEITLLGAVLRGMILTNTVRVSMAENGNEILLVDGKDGWLFDLDDNTFTKVTDEDFPITSHVWFVDGYFMAIQDGSNNFYISALYDGSSWDVLDFSNVVSSSDNLVAGVPDKGNVWFFGTKTVEVFDNTGSASFPFQRIDGAVIETGCASSATVQKFDNGIVWLGVDNQGRGIVWKTSGLSATRISTQAIETMIAGAEDFAESYAYVYHERGHVFYVLQVKGLDVTLVYDGSTGQWHERTYFDRATNTTQQHRGSCHFFFNKTNYIGDRVSGAIYRQSLDLFSYDGEEIHRERVSPHYHEEKKNIPFNSFELDCEVGVGLQYGQGSDPQIMMQYSNDGGKTWSNELWRSLGRAGETKQRVRWSRLGSARDRVFRVRYTEPTFFQINEAYVNAT